MQIKLIFTGNRSCTWPRFESEGFWNSKMAYYLPINIYVVRSIIANEAADPRGEADEAAEHRAIREWEKNSQLLRN